MRYLRHERCCHAPRYADHRFPPETIGHVVWLYCLLALRYRDVEKLPTEHSAVLTCETIRQCCHRLGHQYANALHRRPQPGDRWHLDEVFVTSSGMAQYRWRAVEQRDTVRASGC